MSQRLQLGLEEMRLIRNALYSSLNDLKKELEETKPAGKVKDICDEGIEEYNKLILYFNDKIRAEE